MVQIKAMLKQDAINAYGSISALARASGYSRAAVQRWPDVLSLKVSFDLDETSEATGIVIPRNGKFRRAA